VLSLVALLALPTLLKRADAQETGQNGPEPSPFTAPEEKPISWKKLTPNILHDQGRIWTFPVEVAKGRHIGPSLAFAFTTWAAVALDPADTPYFSRTTTFNGFNKVFTSTRTAIGIAAAPALLYIVGQARHDPYAQKTAILCAEAGADVELMDFVLKSATRRLRPADIHANGDFNNSFFKYQGSLPRSATLASFPSGHAIGAFAVATVIADRYHHKRWVPWVAYGLASVVGFSRVSLQAHFPSDVFAGAFLGYAVGHYIVPVQH
jgi:membrane-associated phospholipid phosphatase